MPGATRSSDNPQSQLKQGTRSPVQSSMVLKHIDPMVGRLTALRIKIDGAMGQ